MLQIALHRLCEKLSISVVLTSVQDGSMSKYSTFHQYRLSNALDDRNEVAVLDERTHVSKGRHVLA
jgi:hypothetical protein